MAYLTGVAVAVALLAIGLVYNQSSVATAGVVVALAVGLLTLVPQLLAANGFRYAEHKEYFAGTLLPQAGGMQLVSGSGVIFLPLNRIAWKLRDDRAAIFPGFGETPLFDGMLRPHLRSGGSESAWSDLAKAFFAAEEKVNAYTVAQRRYDAAFRARLEPMIRQGIGEGFRQVWFEERAMDKRVSESRYATPTYNAGNFRAACELAYSGRFERDPGNRWEYHQPVAAAEDRAQGLPWRVKVGDGDGRDYMWGGPVPAELAEVARALTTTLESLRDDPTLKDLFLRAKQAEKEAGDSLEPLPVLADHAANLLRHGGDIPGTCRYCANWSPRL
jgi:hypothetical protein